MTGNCGAECEISGNNVPMEDVNFFERNTNHVGVLWHQCAHPGDVANGPCILNQNKAPPKCSTIVNVVASRRTMYSGQEWSITTKKKYQNKPV